MAINPLTGEEEVLATDSEVKKEVITTGLTTEGTGPAPQFMNESGQLTTGLTNLKPKATSTTDAVVSGEEVTGFEEFVNSDGTTSTVRKTIFDGFDNASVRDEIAKGSDAGKNFLKEIANRRDLEGTTGEADSILSSIGFSTIKAESEDPSLVSGELALSMADKILSGDKELENLGLAASQINDPDRVKAFLLSQGTSAAQTDAIIKAMESRLKEQRVSKDALTLVERKQAEIDERVAREKADIQTQTQRSQSLLQRQRALRGVGLSTATESDISDLQAKADALSSAATTKGNLEMSLFKAQSEGAEADTINSIRESLQAATDAVNQGILDEVELQNKLVAQGKIESSMAFDNLLETLKVSGADTEAADKGISELTGRLSDKFGNAILVNGKEMPVGGETADNTAAIEQWAKDIANGMDEIGSVPSKLRSKVKAIIAAGFTGDGVLTAEQIGDSRILSEQIFDDVKDDSVNSIKRLMLNGLSNEQIVSSLRDAGFSKEYNGAIRDAFANVVKKLPEGKQGSITSEYNRRLESGDNDSALSYLLTMARDGVTSDQQNKIKGTQALTRDIVAIQDGFTRLMNDPEAQEIFKTGKITGTTEQISQWLGNTTNPKLATIWSEINQAIINYRASKSGAAFSESEAKAYDALFPGGGKGMELNAALIQGIVNTAKRSTESFYEDAIGSNEYNKVFNNGVLDYIYPDLRLSSVKGNSGITPTSISADSSDDDLNNYIFNTGSTSTINTDSSDDDLNGFIFGGDTQPQDFNIGDLTSSSKVGISNIGLGTVTQNFGDTSPLSIDNVRLATGQVGTPGIDIDGKIGDNIPSPINGTVREIKKSSTGLGNSIIIEDENGNLHYFNHLNQKMVSMGDTITAGQVFGTMGNSGSVIKGVGGDGSHLDYRVKSSEGWIDPNQFLIG